MCVVPSILEASLRHPSVYMYVDVGAQAGVGHTGQDEGQHRSFLFFSLHRAEKVREIVVEDGEMLAGATKRWTELEAPQAVIDVSQLLAV